MAYNRYVKLQKYYLGQPVEPAIYKKGDYITTDDYDTFEECENTYYYWVDLVGEYICEKVGYDNYTRYIKQQKYSLATGQPVEPAEYRTGEVANGCYEAECLSGDTFSYRYTDDIILEDGFYGGERYDGYVLHNQSQITITQKYRKNCDNDEITTSTEVLTVDNNYSFPSEIGFEDSYYYYRYYDSLNDGNRYSLSRGKIKFIISRNGNDLDFYRLTANILDGGADVKGYDLWKLNKTTGLYEQIRGINAKGGFTGLDYNYLKENKIYFYKTKSELPNTTKDSSFCLKSLNIETGQYVEGPTISLDTNESTWGIFDIVFFDNYCALVCKKEVIFVDYDGVELNRVQFTKSIPDLTRVWYNYKTERLITIEHFSSPLYNDAISYIQHFYSLTGATLTDLGVNEKLPLMAKNKSIATYGDYFGNLDQYRPFAYSIYNDNASEPDDYIASTTPPYTSHPYAMWLVNDGKFRKNNTGDFYDNVWDTCRFVYKNRLINKYEAEIQI